MPKLYKELAIANVLLGADVKEAIESSVDENNNFDVYITYNAEGEPETPPTIGMTPESSDPGDPGYFDLLDITEASLDRDTADEDEAETNKINEDIRAFFENIFIGSTFDDETKFPYINSLRAEIEEDFYETMKDRADDYDNYDPNDY
jgi:hypothetical protein